MKQILQLFLRIGRCAAVFHLGLLLCSTMHAAVTFTISPIAVSNTYNGSITLVVSGLTNTETVVLQKFLDLNTNGVVDASDLLVQQFNLTDGQAGMVIGGITNFNVPGDIDTTSGQITAKLQFRNGDFMQNIAGKYAFKMSSPGGHFAPITNFLTVTNLPYAQKFIGNVVSNGTSSTLPNAVVLLFPPPRPGKSGPNGSPLAGVVANSSGSYSIPMPPGTYVPVAFKGNYLTSFSTPPVLTLTSGTTITTNLTLTNATSTISGKVADANNSSIGLPGVLFPIQGANGLLGITTTDTNGNFTVGVQSGQWGVKVDNTGLIVHGYLGLQNRTTVNAGQTGISVLVPKATALIYGNLKDNLGNPLPGIDLYASDNMNYLYESDGYTDKNGDYVVGALGGLGSSDPWWVAVSSDTSPAGYAFSQPAFDQNGGTNLSAGVAVQADFTALLATNYIIGNLKANGTNLVGVGVFANATINNADFNVYAVTDSNGNYSFNVGNGNWSVGVSCGSGGGGLDGILGGGNYQCPGNQNLAINNNNGTANFVVQPCNGIQVLTTSLPNAQVGSYYSFSLQGSSCSGMLNWSLNDPQDFPSSLGWGGNGQIQGNPNAAGTYNFSVHLDDGNGHSTNQNLSLYIAPPYTPLHVGTTFLPNGTNGMFYSQGLQATGGQAPYSWSIPNYSASPPPNVILGTNGILSGTLTMTGGPFYFDVLVTDGASNTASQTLSLTIVNPPSAPLSITSFSLPNGTVGALYNAQLGATGGQPPYNWSLALGSASLPPGLSLNSAGIISGAPTTNMMSTFRVQATDMNLATTSQILSLIVNARPSLGSPAWLGNQFQMRLNGVTGQNYTLEMSTDLGSSNWTILFVTNSTTANSFIVTDQNGTTQQRFYRVKVGP